MTSSTPTNEQRASWAAQALRTHAAMLILRPVEEPDEEDFCDLLTNLQHLAKARSWDWRESVRAAEENMMREQTEEVPLEDSGSRVLVMVAGTVLGPYEPEEADQVVEEATRRGAEARVLPGGQQGVVS